MNQSKREAGGGKRLMKSLLSPSGALAAYLVLAPVNALVELGLAYAMSAAVDYAMNGTLDAAGRYILCYIGYILLGVATGYGCKWARLQVLAGGMITLKQQVYDALMAQSYAQFGRKNSAGYLAELTTNMELIRDSLFGVLLALYPELLQFIVATVVMFWVSPLMGGYVLLLAGGQMVIPTLFSKEIAARGKAFTQAQEGYTVTTKENLQSFQTAKLFHMEAYLAKRQREACQKAEQARSRSKCANSLSYELSFGI